MDVTKAIETGFSADPFVVHLGIELQSIGDGWCEAALRAGSS